MRFYGRTELCHNIHIPAWPPEDVNSLKIALRVLTAVTEYDQPSDADVEELRAVVPEYSLRTADVIACEVVRRSLNKRAALAAA